MRRFLHFARYFFYFFFNYSPVLAFCLLADEISGERKYGIKSTGFHQVSTFHELDITGAYSYMPSNYKLLENVFRFINTFPHNHSFLDIGCGKGRAMAVAANFGFTDIKGIEMIEPYCLQAENQLKGIQSICPTLHYEVICGDASNYRIPNEIQTIFLYNPFEKWVLHRVMRNIMKSIEQAPRKIFIIYINPSFSEVLIEAGFHEVYHTSRFRHLKASVFSMDSKF
jgi:SAM-dependent methyltransferase